MILLIVLCVLLSVCLAVSVYLNFRAGETILGYDKFYEDTIADFQEVIKYTQRLKRRELIANDDDFRRLRDLVIVLHDTLLTYVNSRERLRGTDPRAKPGKAEEEAAS